MNNRKPLILINWVSLLWSLLSVRLAARIARWAGFDGLQGSPSRGCPSNHASCFNYLTKVAQILPIPICESTWSSGRKVPWTPLEKLVFQTPKVAKARFLSLKLLPEMRVIGHEAQNPTLTDPHVELHPGLGIKPERMALLARTLGIKLVFDTYHARRDHLFTPIPLDFPEVELLASWKPWRDYLTELAPYITVIHFQPHRQIPTELSDWLAGKPTELGEMLERLKDECPHLEYVVVELAPPDSLLAKVGWVLTIPWTVRAVQRKLREQFFS